LLIGSLVDETFSRVAVESLYYQIPVITTGYGNIRHVLGDSAIYVSYNTPHKWKEALEELYWNQELYHKLICLGQLKQKQFNPLTTQKEFTTLIKNTILKPLDLHLAPA